MGLRISLEKIENHLKWLTKKEWKICSIRELLESISKASKLVAVSFDDGYEDQLAAARCLKNQGSAGTFFRITGLLGEPLGGDNYYKDWKVLSKDGWKEIQGQGHEIGGHSHRHPGPLTLESAENSRKEIENCFDALRKDPSREPPGFSYPHGAHSPLIEKQVKNAGFAYACGSRPGPLALGLNKFFLPRIEISGRDSMADFKNKVEGQGEGWRRLRHDLMRKVWKMQGRI